MIKFFVVGRIFRYSTTGGGVIEILVVEIKLSEIQHLHDCHLSSFVAFCVVLFESLMSAGKFFSLSSSG